MLLRITFLHRLTVHPSVLVSFFSSVFGLVVTALLGVVSAAPRLTLNPFCLMMQKPYAGQSFPIVSADPIGLNSVPEIPALPLVLLRPVVLLDSSQANPFRGGDAGRPVPGLADSSTSPQRLPGRMSPCGPPACIPL